MKTESRCEFESKPRVVLNFLLVSSEDWDLTWANFDSKHVQWEGRDQEREAWEGREQEREAWEEREQGREAWARTIGSSHTSPAHRRRLARSGTVSPAFVNCGILRASLPPPQCLAFLVE